MNARNRDDMVRAFQAAFDEWERRHAHHAYTKGEGGFTGALSERGAYLATLLDDLSDGQPWATIGPGHPAEP